MLYYKCGEGMKPKTTFYHYLLFISLRRKVMSFTKNETVIIAWKNGESAQGHSLHTDGQNLYSDRLKIGYSGGTQRITKELYLINIIRELQEQ